MIQSYYKLKKRLKHMSINTNNGIGGELDVLIDNAITATPSKEEEEIAKLGKKCSKIILRSFAKNADLFSSDSTSKAALATLKQSLIKVLEKKSNTLLSKDAIISKCFEEFTEENLKKQSLSTAGKILNIATKKTSKENSVNNFLEFISKSGFITELLDSAFEDASSNNTLSNSVNTQDSSGLLYFRNPLHTSFESSSPSSNTSHNRTLFNIDEKDEVFAEPDNDSGIDLNDLNDPSYPEITYTDSELTALRALHQEHPNNLNTMTPAISVIWDPLASSTVNLTNNEYEHPYVAMNSTSFSENPYENFYQTNWDPNSVE